MSLNKKKTVREIGRRTRLKNRDIQAVIETLVDVWTEELAAGGGIEIENFVVLRCHEVDRNLRVKLSISKRLRLLLNSRN